MANKIPDQDLADINKIFGHSGEADVISKKMSGQIVSAKKAILSASGFEIKSFSGKIVKHQKSVVIPGEGQKIVAVKGDLFDNIPAEIRDSVGWDDSDFI